MSLLDWAKDDNIDNNHYVKKLAGKRQNHDATEEDLELAKNTIQSYFVVGLMDKMEASIRRFNVVMGIDHESDKKLAKCIKEYFPGNEAEEKKTNANPHPKVRRQ